MSNPVLLVKDAGRGETPACPSAQFKRGDVVAVKGGRRLAGFPRELVVLVAVPPGFPSDYALADLLGEPRPLMIQAPRRVIQYILCRENDPRAYLVVEKDIKATGRSVEIGTISREAA